MTCLAVLGPRLGKEHPRATPGGPVQAGESARSAFGRFWPLLRSALTSRGRVLVADAKPRPGLATYGERSGEVVQQCPRDGTRHWHIKAVRDPANPRRHSRCHMAGL
jgi:hypothetical protein